MSARCFIDNYASGTVMSDGQGVVTFPKLDFSPETIVVWNTEIMLVAAKLEYFNTWFSQIPYALNDSTLRIALANANYNPIISPIRCTDDGVYSYSLSERLYQGEIAYDNCRNAEFYYAIYGSDEYA